MLPFCMPEKVENFRFVPGEFRIRHVSARWEREACAALRRQVFCVEQQIFDGDDRDEVDGVALPIVAIACVAGMPEDVVGAVRIHRNDDGTWFGSRLAVRRDLRSTAWLGTQLIRHAVGTARARGCERFLAHVQLQNVRLFRQLNWTTLEERDIFGRPHHLMQAQLAHYPIALSDDVLFVPMAEHAA